MRWLNPKRDSLESKSKALDKKLAMIRSEIRQLKLSLGDESEGEVISTRERNSSLFTNRPNGHYPHARQAGSARSAPFRKNGNFKNRNRLEKDDDANWQTWIRKIKRGFSKLDPDEARFVNYFAAGSFEGMRPLRYERRVFRNRIIFLSLCFLLFLLTVITLLWPS